LGFVHFASPSVPSGRSANKASRRLYRSSA
jgi:hypothetical protein